ncbi:hypothetical protein ABOM_006121 [Aspergillus bombycis]|uniref:Xylanolytic transcriptional activator regulatory domain-containing protein n=1 Tax=Aspergillus bombycis TaxID=109264 RepID=A0A1F7ZZM0_9EURO|nr:hypothetical protein ABOM_006121 [Aspergillus bombycis]OGM44891.1 hypothetical protein ABOM_006121 [Aspergillus bombycis]
MNIDFAWNPAVTRIETPDLNLHFPGLALRNICVFNGLPFFSSGGRQWIKAQTGEDVDLNQYQPPRRISSLRPKATRTVYLPSESLLFERFQEYKSSVFCQIFPFISPHFFEDTVRAAYQEQSTLTCSNDSAKACVFAFMAVTSMFSNSTANHGSLDSDHYAYAAYDLVPEFFRDTVTIEGLQALLMLCLYSQSVLGDQLSVELLFSAATRFVFHLGGHIFPKRVGEVGSRSLDLQLHIRNLFWLCYIFNQEYSLRTGLPPILTTQTAISHFVKPQLQMLRIPGYHLSSPHSRAWQSSNRRSIADSTLSYLETKRMPNSYPPFVILINFWKTGSSQFPCMYDHPLHIGRQVVKTYHQLSFSYNIIIAWRQSINFCLPYVTAATIHLFCDILLHPRDMASHANLELMDKVRERMLAQLWPQAPISFKMQVQFVEDLSVEVQRLARSAIRKATV